MIAICKIHQAGVLHGGLAKGHHIIRMGGDVRIIDFSLAVRHSCPNSTPVLTSSKGRKSGDALSAAQCQELALVERIYGFRDDRPLEWRKRP